MLDNWRNTSKFMELQGWCSGTLSGSFNPLVAFQTTEVTAGAICALFRGWKFADAALAAEFIQHGRKGLTVGVKAPRQISNGNDVMSSNVALEVSKHRS